MPSSTSPRTSGPTSVRTPSTPRSSNSRAATAASAADGEDDTMRERAISAAVLVPVLLVVLALGGPVLAAAVALLTVLAATEAFRLLRGAGYATFSALGAVLALVIALNAAVPEVLEGSGLLLAAIGIVLIAVASFTRLEPRDGLSSWMATVFGALYVSLLSFIIRLGQAAPDVPTDAPLNVLGAERGWILLLVFA